MKGLSIDESSSWDSSGKSKSEPQERSFEINLRDARTDPPQGIDDEKQERLQLGYSNGQKTLLYGSRKEMQIRGAVKDLVRTKHPITKMYAFNF